MQGGLQTHQLRVVHSHLVSHNLGNQNPEAADTSVTRTDQGEPQLSWYMGLLRLPLLLAADQQMPTTVMRCLILSSNRSSAGDMTSEASLVRSDLHRVAGVRGP